jgi:hypothetical protein
MRWRRDGPIVGYRRCGRAALTGGLAHPLPGEQSAPTQIGPRENRPSCYHGAGHAMLAPALTLLLLANAANACSIHAQPFSGLRLPGAQAGPWAVFTAPPEAGELYLGTEHTEVIPTNSISFSAGSGPERLLIPNDPLAPGTYAVFVGDRRWSETVIKEELGDPGEPPEPPELEVTGVTHGGAEIGSTCPHFVGNGVEVITDAPVVVFSDAPVDSLDGATLLGHAFPGLGGWETPFEGDVYAASVDSEGELSAWTEATPLSHCASAGVTPAGLLAAVVAGLTLCRRSAGRLRPVSSLSGSPPLTAGTANSP